MADHPPTRKRAHTVAYAIKHSQPYDATEAARLLEFLSAEIVGREQTVRNAIALIQRGKYRAARELLLPIARGRTLIRGPLERLQQRRVARV